MERINALASRKQQTCSCGKEYTANYVYPIGDLSHGRCPECRELARKEREAQEKAEAKAKIISQHRQYRLTCGIPDHFQNRDFSSFEKKRPGNINAAFKACWSYAEGFDFASREYHSLMLTGGNGLGKTHLACAIGHHILDRWEGEPRRNMVKYISEPDLLASIQSTYNYNEEEKRYRPGEDDIINECLAIPLLILDDVAKERRRDMQFVRRTLFRIIDGRYTRNRPVVVTTNLTSEGLEEYLSYSSEDTATYDRLMEMCGGKCINLTGESYRRK